LPTPAHLIGRAETLGAFHFLSSLPSPRVWGTCLPPEPPRRRGLLFFFFTFQAASSPEPVPPKREHTIFFFLTVFRFFSDRLSRVHSLDNVKIPIPLSPGFLLSVMLSDLTPPPSPTATEPREALLIAVFTSKKTDPLRLRHLSPFSSPPVFASIPTCFMTEYGAVFPAPLLPPLPLGRQSASFFFFDHTLLSITFTSLKTSFPCPKIVCRLFRLSARSVKLQPIFTEPPPCYDLKSHD